jgi:ubiquinone/menaquinone biosynthesis C-methylase UbiE
MKSILQFNRRLSNSLKSWFPHARTNVSNGYATAVQQCLDGKGRTVIDTGGGARCLFANMMPSDTRIIAVDLSREELSRNKDVQGAVVADVTKHIPIEDASADLVASCYLLEHLRGTDTYVSEAARILKPGGAFVIYFPNKYALFALINRALPYHISRFVLRVLKGSHNPFPAFYENCSPRQFKGLLRKHGLTVAAETYVYYQSVYFDWFAPLFLMSCIYEAIASRLGAENLSAFSLIVATKPQTN